MVMNLSFLFNGSHDLPMHAENVEAARNLVGTVNTVILGALILNTCWYITFFGILSNIVTLLVYYCHVLHFPVAPMVIQFVLILLVVSYMTYYTESVMKSEFLKSKENEGMLTQMREIIEAMPEGVLLISKEN
jgi:hypothetical protein